MHCVIKVNTKEADIELRIDDLIYATWGTSNLHESLLLNSHRVGTVRQYIDIGVVQQMCNQAYEAGVNKAASQLEKIRTILKD